jgi:hypothetical protein
VIKVLIIRPDKEHVSTEEKSFPTRREALAFIDTLKKTKIERTGDGGYRVTL